MSSRSGGVIYPTLLIIIMVFLFFGNAMNVIGPSNVVWLAGLLVASAPLLLAGMHHSWHFGALGFWVYYVALISAIGMFARNNFGDEVSTLSRRYLFLVVLILAFALFSSERLVNVGLRAVGASTIVSVLTNIYEFFEPGTFSVTTGRASGFYLNPNTSALSLVLGMIMSHRVVPKRWMTVFQMAVGLGVLLTASRSGMMCWFAAVLLLQLQSMRSQSFAKSWIWLALIGLAVLFSPFWGTIRDSISGQQDVYDHVITRVGGSTTSETLEDPRLDIVDASLKIVANKPIMGYGTGSPLVSLGGEPPQGTHNTYLDMWIQHGVAGLITLPLLVVVLVRSRKNMDTVLPFAAVILIAGFFSHMLLVQWQYAVAFALVARLAYCPPSLYPPSGRMADKVATSNPIILPQVNV